MAIPNYRAIERWAGQMRGPAEHRSMEGSSVYAQGDTIFSYGAHFPMATIMREPELFVLVNGDRYSNTTSNHQSLVRSELLGVRALIVPFTALGSAGIVRDSIRPLEILEDSWSEHTEYLTIAQAESAAEHGWTLRRTTDGQFEARDNRPTPHETWVPCPIVNGRVQWPVWRHWLGEAVFTAEIVEDRERAPTAAERAIWQEWQEWERKRDRLRSRVHGARTIRVRDYWLGAMDRHEDTAPAKRGPATSQKRPALYGDERWHPIVRYQRRRRARFLSAFDHNEARQVYFLAELPAESRAETVEQALDDLAPPIVKQAWREDIEVARQGDVFAIPCELPAEITRPAPALRARLLGTDHTASEVLTPETGEVYARGIMRHEPERRAPDHARIKLEGWHLIVRNTVPRA